MDFIHHQRENSSEPLLEGFLSATLISCFAKSVQPHSPGSMEKMSWCSANRAQGSTWFLSDHLSRPDKSSCWKSSSFLWSAIILICCIPCISSNFFTVPGVTSTGGTTFTATTWVTLMPLAIVMEAAIRYFTTTATCLLPEITLVYVFTTLKLWGKWGWSPPFRDWVITYLLFPRIRVFIQPCIILDEKASTTSLFFIMIASFKSVGFTVCFVAVFFWIESPAYQQANNQAILNPFKETDNSSIKLSLMMLLIQLMVGVPTVTGIWDPKPVESGTTRATWALS